MKMFKINSVFYMSLFCFIIFLLIPNSINANEWCWTKSMANDPSYVFNSKNGGINWGFCKELSSKPRTVKYDIEVLTSTLPDSGTT